MSYQNTQFFQLDPDLGKGRKINHILAILRRQKEKEEENPSFRTLIYKVRFQCLVACYFPNGDLEFGYILEEDTSKSPLRNEFRTKKEERMLRAYDRALKEIQKNYRNVYTFNKVDIEFAKFRTQQWEHRQ